MPPQTLSLICFSTSPLLLSPKKIPTKITPKKKKKKKPTLVPPSPTILSQKSCTKKLKKNSANARREELEKHWHRLQEEACVVD